MLCDLPGNRRLSRVLDLSFNLLKPEAKEMFLDIAGVCANRPKDFLMAAWTSIHHNSAVISFESLESASLVSVIQGIVRIHDVLRDLGREKIRRDYAGSRVWIEEFSKHPDKVGSLTNTAFSLYCSTNENLMSALFAAGLDYMYCL